jgi:hypothetical protein
VAKAVATPFSKSVVCPVLIGRTSDLTDLHSYINEAKRGSGDIIFVSGEAGIGKARRCSDCALLLLVTYRSDEIRPNLR